MSYNTAHQIAGRAADESGRSRASRLRLIALLAVPSVLISSVLLNHDRASASPAPVSQARGQFLSGTLGGSNLGTVAALNGESAQNTGGSQVTRYNSLDANALRDQVQLPLSHVLQLPGAGVLHLGVAGQYAQANPDGSATAASGAVANSGGISLGGQGQPLLANATLDLTGFGGPSAANTLGGLQLSVGALTATAQQAAGFPGTQHGSYQIGSMSMDLTAPQLANLINPLISRTTATLASVGSAVNSLHLPIAVTGLSNLPDIAAALTTVNVGDGALTVDLRTGSVHLDIAQLLAANGMNLNSLPPGTHLLPYLAQALAQALPIAVQNTLATLEAKLATGFSQLGLSIAGIPLNASQLGLVQPILTGLQNSVTSDLTGLTRTLGSSVLSPLASQLGKIIDPIVNLQSASAGTFTERALQLNVGSGAAVLNLASASVGPSTLPTTPQTGPPSEGSNPPASTPPTTNTPSTIPATLTGSDIPRSNIKIEAGGGLQHGMDPLAALGLVLLVCSGSAAIALGWRRASAS